MDSSSRPPWLASLLDDRSPAPRIFSWTPPGSAAGLSSSPGPDPRRIYILGVGNIGRLYAAHLARVRPDPPPITLVLHRRELLDDWSADPGVKMIRRRPGSDGPPVVETTREGLDVEYWTDEPPPAGEAREIGRIANLIVATKADVALPQVDRLRRYLDGSSTVAFAQNGMSKLWPPHGPAYVSHRWPSGGDAPSFAACITTHGVTSHGPFRSEHASPADAKVGTVLPNPAAQTTGNYLLDTIAAAPGLESRLVSRADLWVLQLEKLVVNSIINPLTAVMRCKNGDIFKDESSPVVEVMDRLLQETSSVYQALINHPSVEGILAGLPRQDVSGAKDLESSRRELKERFSVGPLRHMLWQVGSKVADNTSSMLQDVRAGRKTEIRDFNGWIVDMARFLDPRLGVSCHEALIDLVEGGNVLDERALGKVTLP